MWLQLHFTAFSFCLMIAQLQGSLSHCNLTALLSCGNDLCTSKCACKHNERIGEERCAPNTYLYKRKYKCLSHVKCCCSRCWNKQCNKGFPAVVSGVDVLIMAYNEGPCLPLCIYSATLTTYTNAHTH